MKHTNHTKLYKNTRKLTVESKKSQLSQNMFHVATIIKKAHLTSLQNVSNCIPQKLWMHFPNILEFLCNECILTVG